ncbi:MAG: NADH-quinone oxidoreductase subunit L [Candidatus Methylumidiphilus sp.]
MGSLMTFLVALPPCLLLLAGLAPTGWVERHPAQISRLAGVASVAALAAALAATAAYGAAGERIAGEYVYFDSLSAVMLVLVSFLGATVIRYSQHYLQGDPGQGRFMKWLSLTIGAVLTLIVSGNLVLFTLAWMATSLKLHQLLTFYPDRPAALLAARKKFLISRAGDVCLIVAMALIYRTFGSLQFDEIFAAAAKLHAVLGPLETSVWSGSPLSGISLFLVLGALLKSAQFPFHSWLPEVMETPTPVSALMHAGIINAGGFLIVRMSQVIALAPAALNLLAVVGAVTALVGAMAMLTQTSVKKSLAFSTVGQMGFMMLQCGLGAFSSAILHIVAHSLYKAHAFLSSGSIVDIAKASWMPLAGIARDPRQLLAAFGLAGLLTLLVAGLFGISLMAHPGILVLGAILQIALTYLLWNAIAPPLNLSLALRTVGLAVLVCVAYFALQLGFLAMLQSALPAVAIQHGLFDWLLMFAVMGSFMLILLLHARFPGASANPLWQAAYVHCYNGLYVSTLANRFVQHVWPIALPRKS